jgi:hypothetical protein
MKVFYITALLTIVAAGLPYPVEPSASFQLESIVSRILSGLENPELLTEIDTLTSECMQTDADTPLRKVQLGAIQEIKGSPELILKMRELFSPHRKALLDIQSHISANPALNGMVNTATMVIIDLDKTKHDLHRRDASLDVVELIFELILLPLKLTMAIIELPFQIVLASLRLPFWITRAAIMGPLHIARVAVEAPLNFAQAAIEIPRQRAKGGVIARLVRSFRDIADENRRREELNPLSEQERESARTEREADREESRRERIADRGEREREWKVLQEKEDDRIEREADREESRRERIADRGEREREWKVLQEKEDDRIEREADREENHLKRIADREERARERIVDREEKRRRRLNQ